MSLPSSTELTAASMVDQFQTIQTGLRDEGFARADQAVMRPLLIQAGLQEAGLQDWDNFARSWSDLGPDVYMADGGRYRKRRHGVFSVSSAGIAREAAQPHYQSRDYNRLNGGVQRWFAPIIVDDTPGSALHAILILCNDMFAAVAALGHHTWHVEVHQFRIEARLDEPGQPTPEGMHRDGVDWVLVLLVGRQNVASGQTTIASLAGDPLGSFTLTHPMDAAWVDDNRVKHGVTAIQPLDPALPAYRDVLVVTFRAVGTLRL